MKKLSFIVTVLLLMLIALPGQRSSAADINKKYIKIGIVDSGVDQTDDIAVYKSKNFVTDYIEKNPVFSDVSGHGTAVADIIFGINKNVRLYSAEVLDENNTSSVDRLAAGIEWLIDERVNIINISCGLERDAEKLHDVIQKAYNRGILLIAAAGEGGAVSYPAKYEEVIAVGAVDKNGDLPEGFISGQEIEAFAPGVGVRVKDVYGNIDKVSGTSIAAPHVSAMASRLWQQNPDKPANFIREVIAKSAVSPHVGDDLTGHGYGLIDCTNATDMYDDVADAKSSREAVYMTEERGNYRSTLSDDNEKEVKGYWSLIEHQNAVVFNSQTLKKGTIWPDDPASSIAGMVENPEFHGLYTANYVDSAIYITRVAAGLYKNGKLPKAKTKFQKKLVRAAKKGFEQYSLQDKKEKAYFVYGMAIHTATDIFAHSSTGVCGKNRKSLKKSSLKKLVKKWDRIKHGHKDPATGTFYPATNMADDPVCIPKRLIDGAKKVSYWMIGHAVVKYKAATPLMFSNVRYYKMLSYIEKYGKSSKDVRKKKDYLIKSFGLENLSKYLHYGISTKLNLVITNLENRNIERVIKKWAKD